jgi:hypothetical protein
MNHYFLRDLVYYDKDLIIKDSINEAIIADALMYGRNHPPLLK